MISQIIIKRIDNGYVVKTEYPPQDFDHGDGEEFLGDPKDVLNHVAHNLGRGEQNDEPN